MMLRPCTTKRLLRLGTYLALWVAVCWAQGGDKTTYTASQVAVQVGEGVSISISIMLIGSISFMMGLFYLVNSEDDDIKLYAWKVVSATISIFCAVLLFQAFNGLVEEYCIEGGSKLFGLEEESPVAKIWECVVDILQMVIWLSLMQIVLAVTSGAIAESLPPWLALEDPEEIEIMTKSWAVLFAHISGFAAINAFGSVQQNVLGYNPFTAILIVPLGMCGLQGLYMGFNAIREGVALGDDGEMDELEASWDAECEESENDVAGLSLSFLTAQVLRFLIGGHLPDEEGKEEHVYGFHHSGWHCKLLILWAFVFLIGLMIVLKVRGNYAESPEELKKNEFLTPEEDEEAEVNFKKDEWIIRPLEIFVVYMSCGIAWCFFYGTYWTVAAAALTDQDAMLQVIIAIIISGMSFTVIWLFDKLEDSGALGHSADKAILAIIDALGILIGFSWEQSFDVAVDVISEDVDKYIPKTFARLIMSFALATIVFPAWKAYILPTELELRDQATNLGKRKKRYQDKLDLHGKHFLEGEASEKELHHAHLVMMLHRREHHYPEKLHPGKGIKPVNHGDKPMKHMLLTAAGLTDAPEGSEVEDLLETLLPDRYRDNEEEEGEGRFTACCAKVKGMLGVGNSAAAAEGEEAKQEA